MFILSYLTAPLIAFAKLSPSWTLLVISLLAAVAWRLGAVTRAAAITGAVLTLLIAQTSGSGGLALIVLLFAMTQLSTSFRRSCGNKAGVVAPPHGRRATQILANLGAAAICLLPILFFPEARRPLLIAALASLAESAADTVSSEIGRAIGGDPVLITTGKPVAIGSDGAITWTGSLSGLGAACLMVTLALIFHLITPLWSLITLLAALAGATTDSLLGATLERPGRLGNNAVNFISSSTSAALVLGVWLLITTLH